MGAIGSEVLSRGIKSSDLSLESFTPEALLRINEDPFGGRSTKNQRCIIPRVFNGQTLARIIRNKSLDYISMWTTERHANASALLQQIHFV